ncbi:MAG: hypothetical protein ACRYFZ_16070 [Janthinobacterium lividum]
MSPAGTPSEPQPLAEVLSLMQLRLQLIGHVRAGLLNRAEYDSLFEVLCQTHNLLPWHRDDVTRTVQLVARLAQHLPFPTAP